MKILINNARCRLIGNLKLIDELREETKIRHPNWFYVRRDGWDGYVRYITEAGSFQTGLLPMMLEVLKNHNEKITLEDNREKFSFTNEITSLGGLDLFKHQLGSIDAVRNNKLEGIKFPRGILNEATNAGKTLIAAGLVSSYHKKRTGIFLINNTEIFKQLVKELKELLGEDEVGEVSSKYFKISRFNVCMVQTLANRLKTNPELRAKIIQSDIVLVDEADEVIGRKDTRYVLNLCHEATVKLALTGTALKSHDKLRDQELIAYFGPIIHVTTNQDLIAAGVSVPPVITFHLGNNEVRIDEDYGAEYELGVISNRRRTKRIWKIAQKRINQNRFPILILVRYKKHIRNIIRNIPDELKKYRIEIAHGDIKSTQRDKIFADFLSKKIDILICSMIIRRGKNLKTMRCLINAAGGKSESGTLQLLGRALRRDKGKKKVWVDELYDNGKYLKKHSERRILWYKNDGHEIKRRYLRKLRTGTQLKLL